MRFWEVYFEQFGDYDVDSPRSPGYEWLLELMEENHMRIHEFLAGVELVADAILQKTNTLLLYGPTTTSKTLIMTSLLQLHDPRRLSAMNNASPLYLA